MCLGVVLSTGLGLGLVWSWRESRCRYRCCVGIGLSTGEDLDGSMWCESK